MEDSFVVVVRRISHSLVCFTIHPQLKLGQDCRVRAGLACVCAQKKEHHSRYSFDLTPAQVKNHGRWSGKHS